MNARDNWYWPDEVALWRKLLCIALLPLAVASLLLLAVAHGVAWLAYQIVGMVDGRTGLLTFQEWLRTL